MHISTLDILRCPYCGGRLELVTTLFHRRDGDEVHDGILGCHCCLFPVVAGIPVMHLDEAAKSACTMVQDGQPERARQTLCKLEGERAARFDDIAASDTATYRDAVAVIAPGSEGTYFLHRFSDPSYAVAHPLTRAVAGTVLRRGGRAIDLCGGSGHLTRSLMDLSPEPPVLADLYFAKIWLARRFTAPGCEAVCCDGNAPLPFSRGAFRYAMCADAFMFIWTKRQFVAEMQRLVDVPAAPGTVVITHAHNALVWSQSHGNPLPPGGYRDLFEQTEARLFAEGGLFADVVKGGVLDLARRDSTEALDGDPALVMVASPDADVFARHPVDRRPGSPGVLRVNPLYVAEAEGDRVRLRLQLPTEDYADEFGACRQYMPDEVVLDRSALTALAEGRMLPEMADLSERRVILDLPVRYW